MRALVVATLLLAIPSAFGASAFVTDGTLGLGVAYAQEEVDEYVFAVQAGEGLVASLSWRLNPGSPGLAMWEESPGCSLFPESDADCLAGEVSRSTVCPPDPVDDLRATREIVASRDGRVVVAVWTRFVASELPYHLAVWSDEGVAELEGTRLDQRSLRVPVGIGC